MVRCIGLLLFACFLTLSAVGGQAPEKKIVMTHVKYDGLKQEVLKHRGKVVIVDFWASWCPSCKKAFPNFIEMQKKYADKGLVVLAVSLDDVNEAEKVVAANKFLNKVNSPFANLLLVEPSSVWPDKFGFESLPAYFVFDRQGKWVRYRSADYETGVPYGELEKVVVKMLDGK